MPSRVQCYPPIEDRSLQLTSEIDMNGLNQPNWTVRILRLTIFWMDSFKKMLSNLLFGSPVSDQSPIAREGFESPLSAIGSQLGSCSPVAGLKPIPSSRWDSRGSTAFPMLSPFRLELEPPSNSQALWPSKPIWLTFHCHVSPPVMLLQTGAARVFGSTLADWGNFGAGGSWKENTASYSSIWNPINHSKPPNQGVFKGKYGESTNVTNTRNWTSTGLGPSLATLALSIAHVDCPLAQVPVY